jgi:ElaA protein
MKLNWIIKKFDALSVHELYAILQLRNEVFVIEQNCIYPDMDDKDQLAEHLMCFESKKLIGYTRILSPGISYSDPSIGRVVTAQTVRKTGVGKELMARSIEACINLYGNTDITLSAQLYLKKFYELFGFKISGDGYLEDGIEHIKMIRKAYR